MESGGQAGAYVPAPPDTMMDKLGDWMYDSPTQGKPEPGESHMKDQEGVLEYLMRMMTGG